MTPDIARHKLGERCLFQPNINKISWDAEKLTYTTDPYSAVECEICEVIFAPAKVYYSVKVRYHDSEKDIWIPIQRVDSLMICSLM